MAEAAKLVNNADVSNPTPSIATIAKLLPDVSKIKVFTGQNFHRWKERVHTLLDMHWGLSLLKRLTSCLG